MGGPKGFFIDAIICIGCKACELACKQWNQLPDDGFAFTGASYDNTGHLGASTFRHVVFVERLVVGSREFFWSMLSDVCKYCESVGCFEVCFIGVIVRTKFNSIYIQPNIYNG